MKRTLRKSGTRLRGPERLEGRALLAADPLFARALVSTGSFADITNASNNAGEVYLGGTFRGMVDFDPGPSQEIRTSTAVDPDPSDNMLPPGDGFLAKYSPRGELVWLRTFPVENGQSFQLADLAVGADGRIAVVGAASAGIDLDPGPGMVNPPGMGAFVLTFDPQGFIGSASRFATTSADPSANLPSTVAVDAAGALYVAGSLNDGTTDFDPGPGQSIVGGQGDSYLVKLNADQSLAFVDVFVSADPGNALIGDIAPVPGGNGDIYLGGTFRGTVDFDPRAGVQNRSSTSQFTDAFLVRLNANGAFVQVATFGGSGSDSLGTVDLLTSGNAVQGVVVGATVTGAVNLGGGITVPSQGGFDVVAARFSPSLAPVWGRSIGGSGNSVVSGIGVDGAGTIYLGGTFTGQLNFQTPGGGSTVTARGGSDLYIVALNGDGTVREGVQIGGSGTESSSFLQVSDTDFVTLNGLYVAEEESQESNILGIALPTAFPNANAFFSRISFRGDVVGPAVDAVGPVDPAFRTTPVGSIDVVFTEPINRASFTTADLSLTRNGAAVSTAGLSVAPVAGASLRYRVSGLAPSTGADGNYVFSVNAAGINDTAGNAGSGVRSTSFTVDTVRPSIVSVGPVDPSPRNVPVGTIDVVFSESIALPSFTADDVALSRNGAAVSTAGLSVAAVPGDPTRYRVSGLAPLTGDDGNYVFGVGAGGISDPAGNVGSGGVTTTSFTVDSGVTPVDPSRPMIVSILPVEPAPRTAPFRAIDVSFSEPIDVASFTVDDLVLRRNGTPVPIGGGVSIAQIPGTAPGAVPVYRISGLEQATATPGSYTLTVLAEGIFDPDGNPGVPATSNALTRSSLLGDYDGDGTADLALYEYDTAQSAGVFAVRLSNNGSPVDRTVPVADVDANVIPVAGDFDGDGRTDFAVVNPTARLGGATDPNASVWIILLSGSNDQRREVPFGAAGVLDRPAPADFDGDGITDIATFRANSDLVPGAAQWFILPSAPNPGFQTVNGAFTVLFGAAGGVDLPAPADYDGDGRADIATFRPISDLVPGAAQWFILPSAPNDATYTTTLGGFPITFGAAGNADQPALADFNGDGRDDITTFRSVTDLSGGERWFILPSEGAAPNFGGGFPVVFGQQEDIAAVSDYTRDGRPDLTVYTPGTDTWISRDAITGLDQPSVVFNPLGDNAVPVLSPLFFRLRATGNIPGPDPIPLTRLARVDLDLIDSAVDGLFDDPTDA